MLHKIAKITRIKKSQFAKTITLKIGKILSKAEGEINLSADVINYYSDNAEVFLANKVFDLEYAEAIILNSPISVLLRVITWNFPYYHVARFAALSIMVGNTVLFTHASVVPQCADTIEKIFEEAKALEGL